MRPGDGIFPWVQVRYVARPGTGHTPSRSRPELWAHGDRTVPWFTLADVWQIRDGARTVVTETAERVTPVGLANSAAVMHPAGTVLLSRTASVGFSAVMGVDMAVSQDFMTWTPGPRIDGRFLLWALRGLRGSLHGLMYGSTHKTIYMPDLLALRVPLPPIDIQRNIVDFLDRESERIARLKERSGRMLTVTDEKVQQLRHHLLSGAELDAALLEGAWPSGWPRLSHLVDSWHSGGTPEAANAAYWTDADGAPDWLAIGDMSGRRFAGPSSRRLTPMGIAAGRLKPAPSGTLLLAMYASVGELAELDRSAYFNQALIGMFIADPAHREFVYEWVTLIRPHLQWFVKSNTQANLTADLVRRLPVPPFATADLERRLASIRSARGSQALINEKVSHLRLALDEYRDALITEAVAGEFNVHEMGEAQMDERARAVLERTPA